MEEIKVKKNDLNLKVYIDKIDFSLISNVDLDLIIKKIEPDVFAMIQKKRQKRQQKNVIDA